MRPLAQLMHPFAAGFQSPHEPPSPRGQPAAAVVAGGVAVTVTVRVLVDFEEVVLSVPLTVTTTVLVEVDGGVTIVRLLPRLSFRVAWSGVYP